MSRCLAVVAIRIVAQTDVIEAKVLWNLGVLCQSNTSLYAQQNNSMDVRVKQRLRLVSCPLDLGGLSGGFTPRHLSRYALAF